MKKSASTKAEYQKYLQSTHWQQRRKQAIEDTGHICEKCDLPRWLAQIAYQQDLNVHHLNYSNLGHEEDCDLEVLCRRCHDIETFGRSDFRAPKKSSCDICDCHHWDTYGGLCEICSSLLGNSEPFEFRLCSVYDGKSVWIVILKKILRWMYERGIQSDDFLSIIVETRNEHVDLQRRIANDPDGIPF